MVVVIVVVFADSATIAPIAAAAAQSREPQVAVVLADVRKNEGRDTEERGGRERRPRLSFADRVRPHEGRVGKERETCD